MNHPQGLKPAAAVILLKPVQPRGFEVLLTRRSAAGGCGSGIYGFPGGPMREEDWSDLRLACSRGLTPNRARAIVGAHFPPRKALGLWLTAIRELFEEIGILLATEMTDERILVDRSRITEMHATLPAKTVSFEETLHKNHLLCDAARLSYFSHWQTPADAARRFDTYLFLSLLPESQIPLPASDEVLESLWLTPDRALQLFGKSELPMVFPTFAALRTLADFDSLDRVLKEFQPPSGV